MIAIRRQHLGLSFDLFVMMIIVTLLGGCQPKGSSNAKQPDIRYEALISNAKIGGQSNVTLLLVPEEYKTKETMTALGQRLKTDFKRDPVAFVYVYDNENAAMSRSAVLFETADEATTKLHDEHLIAVYIKNADVSLHDYVVYYNGANGSDTEVFHY